MLLPQPKLIPSRHPITKVREYELLDDYPFTHEGHQIRVPRGFTFDGASIPDHLWNLIDSPYDPIVMAPAMVHDWLYMNHQTNRLIADTIFHEMLRDNGVPAWKA